MNTITPEAQRAVNTLNRILSARAVERITGVHRDTVLSRKSHKRRYQKPTKQAAREDGKCACGCGQTTSISLVDNKQCGIKKGEHFTWIKGHWHAAMKRENPNWGAQPRKAMERDRVRLKLARVLADSTEPISVPDLFMAVDGIAPWLKPWSVINMLKSNCTQEFKRVGDKWTYEPSPYFILNTGSPYMIQTAETRSIYARRRCVPDYLLECHVNLLFKTPSWDDVYREERKLFARRIRSSRAAYEAWVTKRQLDKQNRRERAADFLICDYRNFVSLDALFGHTKHGDAASLHNFLLDEHTDDPLTALMDKEEYEEERLLEKWRQDNRSYRPMLVSVEELSKGIAPAADVHMIDFGKKEHEKKADLELRWNWIGSQVVSVSCGKFGAF